MEEDSKRPPPRHANNRSQRLTIALSTEENFEMVINDGGKKEDNLSYVCANFSMPYLNVAVLIAYYCNRDGAIA
jgi:hypothetical protein